MNEAVVHRFETLGRWLFRIHFMILIGLALCWAGFMHVDRADSALAGLALVVVSLYLAVASFVAAAVYRSCGSRLAMRFFNLAAVAGLSGLAGPLIAALIWRS